MRPNSRFIGALALSAFFLLHSSLQAAPATNVPLMLKPSGDVINVPNFGPGKHFKIDGVTVGDHLVDWSNIPEPTITALNLLTLGLPSPASYILVATDGTSSYNTAATIVAAGLPVSDATTFMKGSSDATKLIRFEVDGNTTATTRVYTVPNYNGTFATLAGTEAFTGGKTYNGMTLKVGTAAGTTDSPTETEAPAAVNFMMHTKVGWGATTGGLEFRTHGPSRFTFMSTSGIIPTVSGGVKTTSDSTVASASTLALGAATGIQYDITGTTPITLITGIGLGEERILRFTGATTLVSSSNLKTPGGEDIPVDAGSVAFIIGEGSGVVTVTDFKYSDGFSKKIFDDIYMNPGANIGFADEGGPFFDVGRSRDTGDGGGFIRVTKADDVTILKHDLSAGAALRLIGLTSTRFYTFRDRDGILVDDTDLALKANLASPTFTGTPLSTTAAVDTNTTQIATTAFVIGQGYAKLVSPSFTTPNLGAATGTSIAFGSDPADAGVVRLENAAVIGWEASPAGTDVTMTVNSSERFVFSHAISAPALVSTGVTYDQQQFFQFVGGDANWGFGVRNTGSDYHVIANFAGAGDGNRGFAVKNTAGADVFRTTDLYTYTQFKLGIGTTTFGTSAVNVLGIANGTEPSTSPADMVQLYSVDLSAGNATLGIRTETAVATEAVTSDRTLSVRINGATYKILLDAP